MFSKTRFAATVCSLSLLAGCATQTSNVGRGPSTPASSNVSAAPPIECPGVTIRSAADADLYAACEVILGHLTIRGTSLTNLVPFSNVRVVRGALVLADNHRLRSVRGLEGLEAAQSILVRHNNALESLEGLASMTNVERITIDSNPRLQDLSGLERVQELDELVLHKSGLLTVEGLDGLARVGRLAVTHNPRLINLSALNGVTHANSVRIESNPRLAGQPGLLRSLVATEEPIVVKGNSGLSRAETTRLRAKGSGANGLGRPLISACAP